jgi:hypothetical protein
MNTKQITLLHSNDMHGDFLAEVRGKGGHLIGGLALLAGYLDQVRRTETHVPYKRLMQPNVVLNVDGFTLMVRGFNYNSSESNANLTRAELTALAGAQVVTTSARDVLEEYMRSHQNISSQVEGRLQHE